jgi:hypothetical protein
MRLSLTVVVAVSLCTIGLAQATDNGLSAKTSKPADPESSMTAPLQAALTKYVAANNAHNMQDLLAIWPMLQTQKKEYNKIKDHFADVRISDEHFSVEPLVTRILNDNAIVECNRIDEFSKTQTKTDFGGDLNMGNSPAQSIPPNTRSNKSRVRKADRIWIKLHKSSDTWQIVSVTGKPEPF